MLLFNQLLRDTQPHYLPVPLNSLSLSFLLTSQFTLIGHFIGGFQRLRVFDMRCLLVLAMALAQAESSLWSEDNCRRTIADPDFCPDQLCDNRSESSCTADPKKDALQ